MNITACFVTRNHESSLDASLASVRALSAQLIVVDTGSTDRTIAVAYQHGATVVEFPWNDDFSAAQNAALDRATGDWILWLNPDEEVDPQTIPLIERATKKAEVFAYDLRIVHEYDVKRPGFGPVDWQPRLFRRDPDVRYHRRLHPTFTTPLSAIASKRGQCLDKLNGSFFRHGYLSVPTAEKMQWVVKLLEAELRDRPEQLDLTIELGRNYLRLNDPRGHDVLAMADQPVRALATHGDAPPAVGMFLEYLLTVSPEQRRSQISREEATSLADRWFARTPPVLWALSCERYAARDYAKCAERLNRLLALGRSGDYDASATFSTDILGPSAILNLGLCHFQMKNWTEAKDCFEILRTDPTRSQRAARLYAQATRNASS